MLTPLYEPSLEEVAGGGSRLVLWLCEPIDFDFSFRGAIADLLLALNAEAPSTCELPATTKGEDFVEGRLRWGDAEFEVYFEYNLGYLQFTSSSTPDVMRLRSVVLSNSSFKSRPPTASA